MVMMTEQAQERSFTETAGNIVQDTKLARTTFHNERSSFDRLFGKVKVKFFERLSHFFLLLVRSDDLTQRYYTLYSQRTVNRNFAVLVRYSIIYRYCRYFLQAIYPRNYFKLIYEVLNHRLTLSVSFFVCF